MVIDDVAGTRRRGSGDRRPAPQRRAATLRACGLAVDATLGRWVLFALAAMWSLDPGLASGATPVDAEAHFDGPAPAQLIQRGRYVVLLSHCNNCHTAGYSPAQGDVPEERWLTGNPIGWRSRQGTTYAANLRLFVKDLSESDWIKVARLMRSRAPMPWWTLRDTSDADLKAMYWYIRSLKPLGDPAPAFLPPDQVPRPPYSQLPDMSVGGRPVPE